MKPGRELDILVAEKVMGWRLLCYESGVFAYEPGQYDDAMKNDGWAWNGDKENREAHEFNPSTDIACAWEVFEKLSQLSSVFKSDTPFWCCWWGDVYETGLTAPHAICLAALKAVGHE